MAPRLLGSGRKLIVHDVSPEAVASMTGAGAQAATQNLSADIVSFSRAKGIYGGVSVDGAVVATRDALNKAYYGKAVSPTDILLRHTVSNKKAAGLVSAVSKAAGK